MGVVSCGSDGLVVAHVGRNCSLEGRHDNVSSLTITTKNNRQMKDVGVVKDEVLNLEEIEVSHTLGGVC